VYRELQRRGLLPQVRAWKLHRRVFLLIASAILLTAVVVSVTAHWVNPSPAGPHPGAARHTVLPVALAVIVLWAIASRIAWRLVRPLRMVIEVAEQLGQGNLKARAKLSRRRRGEERVLAKSINRMADRIERQLADQRELLAQVSHELRTPLGHLRLLVEMAREAPSDKTLDEMDAEIAEIDALVGDLLASSRVSFEALTFRELDAAELAVRALERAHLPAELLHVTGAPRISADATLVIRALGNLIENAQGHGGGVAALELTQEPGQVRFAVADHGPGFAAGDESRAFDPFFHRARSEDGSGGSLGLGLALVARIAAAHGGEARAENRAGSGACVSFTVRAAPPDGGAG